MAVKTLFAGFLFIMPFTICVSLRGQQAAPDVYGWNTTKWDMSLAQVKAAVSYPIEPIPDPTPGMPAKDTFQIANVEESGFPGRFTLHFYQDRLKSVELVIQKDAVQSADSRSRAFDSLKQSLIEKYGKPATDDTWQTPATSLGKVGETDHIAFWIFPSTSIRLRRIELASGGVVAVEYTQVDKTAP